MSRVALSSLRSLTFYRGSLTKARRVDPIKQLNCHGTACGLYQPEVVRCYNEGGEGIDIDWRCEADLPEKLRFGKVEVSCEGWDRPGDPYILKGSCGLDYRLVSINDSPSFENSAPWPYLSFLLFLLVVCVFFAIHYGLFKNCCRPRPRPNMPRPNLNSYYPYERGNNSPPSPPPGPPPPPYSSTPKEPQAPNNSSNSTFTPGFWTGVGVGGLGAAAAQRMFQNRDNQARPPVPVHHEDHSRPYDWESRHNGGPSSRTPMWGPGSNNNNRGGSSGGSSSSGLGSMRRATGYGSTNVR